MKRILVICILTGGILCLAGLLLPAFLDILITDSTGAVGIIGGADRPTANYILSQKLYRIDLVMLSVGAAFILTAIICFFLRKHIHRLCSAKTALLTLLISADTAVGVYGSLLFLSCFFFSNPNRHPIRFPASTILIALSLIFFVWLIILYGKMRRETPHIKGILIDGLFFCISLVPFFMILTFITQVLEDVLHI